MCGMVEYSFVVVREMIYMGRSDVCDRYIARVGYEKLLTI